MADTKISALADAGTLDGTEELAVVQSGTTKRATAADVARTGMSVAKAYQNSAGNSSGTGAWVKVALDATEFDTASWWDGANDRFIPDVAGYYMVQGRARSTGNTLNMISLYKNGSIEVLLSGQDKGVDALAHSGSAVVYCNGSTDYLELYAYELQSGQAYTNSAAHTYLIVSGPIAV